MPHFDRETLLDLVAHADWADSELWNAVAATPRALDDVGIRDYLHHIHMVQRLFVALWTQQPPDAIAARQPSEFSLSDLRAWGRPFYADARGFLQKVDAPRLDEPLIVPWAARLEAERGLPLSAPTVGETVFQVVNHTTHHRAQVSVRLRALGGEPPLVDYIAWVWFGRPPARSASDQAIQAPG
jgi:uncharacterized damage-inducible protein DinB